MKYLHTSSVTAWKVWPRKQAEGRIRLKDYVVRLRTNSSRPASVTVSPGRQKSTCSPLRWVKTAAYAFCKT